MAERHLTCREGPSIHIETWLSSPFGILLNVHCTLFSHCPYPLMGTNKSYHALLSISEKGQIPCLAFTILLIPNSVLGHIWSSDSALHTHKTIHWTGEWWKANPFLQQNQSHKCVLRFLHNSSLQYHQVLQYFCSGTSCSDNNFVNNRSGLGRDPN